MYKAQNLIFARANLPPYNTVLLQCCIDGAGIGGQCILGGTEKRVMWEEKA